MTIYNHNKIKIEYVITALFMEVIDLDFNTKSGIIVLTEILINKYEIALFIFFFNNNILTLV